MSSDSPDMRELSDEAQRWLGFFHVHSRDAAQVAIDTGFIAPRKRPGFTPTVFDEIREWAAQASADNAPSASGPE
jgi:hypothetical protein